MGENPRDNIMYFLTNYTYEVYDINDWSVLYVGRGSGNRLYESLNRVQQILRHRNLSVRKVGEKLSLNQSKLLEAKMLRYYGLKIDKGSLINERYEDNALLLESTVHIDWSFRMLLQKYPRRY